jgi:hypothetical protein
MMQFVTNLKKVTAAKRVEHSVVDAVHHSLEIRSFDYAVMVLRGLMGGFLLGEYRNGSVDPA